METMTEALVLLFTIENILYLNFGLFIGIVVGAVPGLTAMLAITLCVPLTFGMSPVSGIVLLLGLYVGGSYGGSITAILINTPGAPAAAATVLDGYPLTKKGQAKKALDIALYSSTIGGFISGLILLFMAPQIAKASLNFGPPEFFALSLFGISIISSVSGKNIFKGILSGALGILVGCIGVDGQSVQRFVFGNYNLMSGISLTIALIGLFALAEVLINKNVDTNIKRKLVNLKGSEGVTRADMKKCLPTIIKGTLIGNGIGAVPGTGGGISTFLSYSQAKKSSKNPEEFGHGALEGVAAAESANNATTGTALIPMLTLGLPGDTATAIMMGALMVHGLNPGPKIFETSGSIIYAIIIGFLIINLLMLVQGKLLIPIFVKISSISYVMLAPMIAIFCVAGAFSTNNSIFDVSTMLYIAIAALIMNTLDIPRAPMLLGLVLGSIIEENFIRAMVMSSNSLTIFFTRPIALVFMLLAIFSLCSPVIKKVYLSRKKVSNEEV